MGECDCYVTCLSHGLSTGRTTVGTLWTLKSCALMLLSLPMVEAVGCSSSWPHTLCWPGVERWN